MKKLHSIVLLFLFCCVVSGKLFSQTTNAREKALSFVRQNAENLGLTPADVTSLRVTDEYVSEHNGVTHVWVQQEHHQIPVYNALFGLHVTKEGEVVHVGHRFEANIAQRVNTKLPSLDAKQAISMAFANLGYSGFPVPNLKKRINSYEQTFDGGAVARREIPAHATYLPQEDGTLRLSWMLTIDQANSSDVWAMFVDAQTGLILDKQNQTVYCSHSETVEGGRWTVDGPSVPVAPPVLSPAKATTKQQGPVFEVPAPAPPPVVAQNTGTYRVYALPTESPAHGPQILVTNPADTAASPFGWHDINGQPGPEYFYTRGNNTWTYDDITGNSTGTVVKSVTDSNLVFDFLHNTALEPIPNRVPSLVNLFYATNRIHDITYRHGFNEVSGNFQTNNYGKGGRGNDAVLAEGLDGSGENNANFSTPPDGSAGRMQMFLWSSSANVVKVNEPVLVRGEYYGNVTTDWGKPITTVPVTGDVAIANDGTGSADATKACTVPTNDLKGKIAIVDRGICEFGRKAFNVQQAGAIACIVCNFEDANIGMAAGAVGNQVTIPTLLMQRSVCARLREFAGRGLNISLVLPATSGPAKLDGGFDNGIIAHEYGHGVSSRLTGGPTKTTSCLGNAEQMGEGWSDWLTLISTVKPGDTPQRRRGVGTYVEREPNDGNGIRRFPYSTDMSISEYTYQTVSEDPASVHAVGSVWAAMLWDLYWAMVAKYGYDADIKNKNSGNFRAVQLVMDGMKLQPCAPGFVDGRNAIMLANRLNYGGADTCLISSVFARRGLGIGSNQGLATSAADGTENFEPIPTCVKELKVQKIALSETIDPGQEVAFRLTVTNHKDSDVTNVVVADQLPEGLSLVSATNGGTGGAGTVTWNIPRIASGVTLTLSYVAKSDPKKGSISLFRDQMDLSTNDNWISYQLRGKAGRSLFELQNRTVRVGTHAWNIVNPVDTLDAVLEYLQALKIKAKRPVLRFWNQFNTEAGNDAGMLEFKLDQEKSPWVQLPLSRSFRNGYNRSITYQTFVVPFLSGFSGQSNGWQQSYLELNDWLDKSFIMRFRFGSNETVAPAGGGWWIDDLELLDLLTYDGEATVTSTQGDRITAKAPRGGVVVNPPGLTSVKQLTNLPVLPMQVQPNPATGALFVNFGQQLEGDIQTMLIAADGRVVLQQRLQNQAAVRFDLQNVPAGVYTLRVENKAGTGIEKVVIY